MQISKFLSVLALGIAPLIGQATTAAAAGSFVESVARTASKGYNNVVYFADWVIYARNYQPYQLPIDKLTHVLYSFANIQEDGTV